MYVRAQLVFVTYSYGMIPFYDYVEHKSGHQTVLRVHSLGLAPAPESRRQTHSLLPPR